MTTVLEANSRTNVREKKSKDTFLTILVCLFVIFSIAPDFFEFFSPSISWYIGLAIALVCFIITLFKKKIQTQEIVFYLLLVFLLSLSSLFNRNVKFTIVIQYFRYLFMAMALIRIRLSKAPLYLLHLFLCLYLLFQYLVLKTDVTEIMVNGVSQNSISLHVLFIQTLILIAERKMFKKLLFLSLLLSFVVIVWTGCRSGLITISFLIVSSYVAAWMGSKHKMSFFFVTIILLALIIGALATGGLFEKMFEMISSRTQKFSDNIRFKFMSEFFESTREDPYNFFFGPSLETIPSIHKVGDNPHNSFINMYAKFGLAGFILILGLIFASLYKYIKINNYYGALLFAICIRSFTDVAAFPNMYDVLFYYFIFEYWTFSHCYKTSVSKNLVKENNCLGNCLYD